MRIQSFRSPVIPPRKLPKLSVKSPEPTELSQARLLTNTVLAGVTAGSVTGWSVHVLAGGTWAQTLAFGLAAGYVAGLITYECMPPLTPGAAQLRDP